MAIVTGLVQKGNLIYLPGVLPLFGNLFPADGVWNSR